MKRRREQHRERERKSDIISPSLYQRRRQKERKGKRRDSTDEQLVTSNSR
jgi:hypothetical protein